MRKIILSIIVLMTIGAAANAQKFALIDMEYILENIPSYKQGTAQLEEISKGWQGEVESLMKQAQTMYNDYQSRAGNLTEAQKTAKENEIVAKEKEANELRKKYFGPEGEMAQRSEKIVKPVEDKIYQAVKTIAEQQGYSVVLDRASATSIIFASPRIDISNEVLGLLGY